MKKKLALEIEKDLLLKAARSTIRLKHSLAADAEVNDRIPELEAKIDQAIAHGRSYTLNLNALLA